MGPPFCGLKKLPDCHHWRIWYKVPYSSVMSLVNFYFLYTYCFSQQTTASILYRQQTHSNTENTLFPEKTNEAILSMIHSWIKLWYLILYLEVCFFAYAMKWWFTNLKPKPEICYFSYAIFNLFTIRHTIHFSIVYCERVKYLLFVECVRY